MASLDSLPPDQRAVLQLVLQRGRSYDDIAQLLSIDRAAVRERALAAFDALGPQTRVTGDRRALITDYLLGQLPARVSDETRDRLAGSASERAWARVLASELAPLASGPLPEIPADGARQAPAAPAGAGREPAAAPVAPAAETVAAGEPAKAPRGRRARDGERRIPPAYGAPEPQAGGERPRSRLGGAILLGVVAIAVIVVVVILVTSGGGKKHSPAPATPTTTSATGTTKTSTTPTKQLAQINLTSPTGAKNTGGIAEVVQQGSTIGIVIAAQGITPNTKHNAYAVWLYNPGGKSDLLGFVSPAVGKNGRLQTAGPLPKNASSYKELLVTIETVPKPKTPGTIVLQGALTLS